MTKKKYGGRVLKKKVFKLLNSTDLDTAIDELCQFPARQVINPLFSFLNNSNEQVKWRSVTAMGKVVANLANKDMESARVIMWRLIWNLNDESGGIGWGSSEAMGEILACHEGLAKEYAHILISFARENGNYLEHEILQRGLLWGIGRLSQVRPHLVRNAAEQLMLYLNSPDAAVRGHAAWTLGLLDIKEAQSLLDLLAEDESELQIYLNRRIVKCRIKDIVEDTLNRFSSCQGPN